MKLLHNTLDKLFFSGFIQASLCKIQGFSRTFKRCFQGLEDDSHYEIQFLQMLSKIYHMMLLLLSGYRHVINNVITTHYITIWVGTSNVITTSVTTMQIFIEIN